MCVCGGSGSCFKRDVPFKCFTWRIVAFFSDTSNKSDSQTARHAFASEKGVNRNVLQRVVSDVFDCSLM